jgi:hypothetical protein
VLDTTSTMVAIATGTTAGLALWKRLWKNLRKTS